MLLGNSIFSSIYSIYSPFFGNFQKSLYCFDQCICSKDNNYLKGSAECSPWSGAIQNAGLFGLQIQSFQSIPVGVQSKTLADFGLECGLHSKNFAVANALLKPRIDSNCWFKVFYALLRTFRGETLRVTRISNQRLALPVCPDLND